MGHPMQAIRPDMIDIAVPAGDTVKMKEYETWKNVRIWQKNLKVRAESIIIGSLGSVLKIQES